MPEQVRIGWRPYVDSGLDVSATAFSNALIVFLSNLVLVETCIQLTIQMGIVI